MSAGPQPPASWSFDEPPPRSTSQQTRRWKRVVATSAVVSVVAVVALAAWLVWPTSPAAQPVPPDLTVKPLLGDQPPTVILNGLDFRSLYPPGYVDFDSSKSDLPGPEELGIDMAATYTSTSQPPGCSDDPLSDAQYDFDSADPDHYRRYPLSIMMYPVENPGGVGDDNGFILSIFPAPNPDDLNEFRDYYRRCHGAQLTMTQTKDGRIIRETTATLDNVVADAPPSNTVDSFELTQGETGCGFVGLTRGVIVTVQCPTAQRDAGINLFRTVVDRVNAI